MMFTEALMHPLALYCRLNNSFISNISWFPYTETSGLNFSLIWIPKWFKIQARKAHMAGLEPPRPTKGGYWMSFFAKCLPIVSHDVVFSVHSLNIASLWVLKLSISFVYVLFLIFWEVHTLVWFLHHFCMILFIGIRVRLFSSPFTILIQAP